jgi:hypothetical protein
MAENSKLVKKESKRGGLKPKDIQRMLKAAEQEYEGRADSQVARIHQTEGSVKKAEEERDAAQKKLDKIQEKQAGEHYRSNILLVDGITSALAQTLNAGEQWLLDYLIEKFPSIGSNSVKAKGLPPLLALIWYLIEVFRAKKTDKMHVKARAIAANLLTNLGLVHLRLAYADRRKKDKDSASKLAQTNEELAAQASLMKKDLDKAKKLLQDNKIDFSSDESDQSEEDNG